MALTHSDPQTNHLNLNHRLPTADTRTKTGPKVSVLESSAAEPVPLPEHEELVLLRVENGQLRARLEELEQILEGTTEQTEQMWGEQQKEYEMLLEEKSEVIRSLHQQLHETRETAGASDHGLHQRPSGADRSATADQLTILKEQLEEERMQLQRDEEALMTQLREMEMAMSKDRVELARQRGELQRLHQDLQREIEMAQKDGGLRDRLVALQRRAQPDAVPAPSQNTPIPGRPAPRRALPTQSVLPNGNGDQKTRPNSGFLRRLFG